jgi:probable rRNA maturation factor
MEMTKQKEISEVSILLTDDKEIQTLNKIYRNIDAPTDVLAFSLLEGQESFLKPDIANEYLLGDIVISVETAQRQAISLGHSLQNEIIILAIHGFLHLIGYDHNFEPSAIKMRSLEENIYNYILENNFRIKQN